MRAFEYRHVVSFEETNVVGNVYYVNHLRWQGRCREMFLREHAPRIVDEIARGLALVTTRVSCEYLDELRAFDELVVRMYAGELTRSRITMRFDYFRVGPDGAESLVARGEQQVACMRAGRGGLAPAPVPEALREALAPYLDDGRA